MQPLGKPSTQHALTQQHRQSGRVGPQLSVPTQRSGSRITHCHGTGEENTLLEMPRQHHSSHAAHSSEARNIIARTAPPHTQTSLPDATRTDAQRAQAALDAAEHTGGNKSKGGEMEGKHHSCTSSQPHRDTCTAAPLNITHPP
ncbi:hypothetical protein DQ04_12301010 [Trypanosoma grayi]|uniref:hypothetical protein n=1 Tax=Trypanosoma grayi TaxID=71804 RepID=UPI0004F3FE67|nr:hypothetical protein DQ04_12301010 [Trypanosoma grayi]KEG06773.1 hypothetical protein DQ04_12301010 [Trypanosoma grayi]